MRWFQYNPWCVMQCQMERTQHLTTTRPNRGHPENTQKQTIDSRADSGSYAQYNLWIIWKISLRLQNKQADPQQHPEMPSNSHATGSGRPTAKITLSRIARGPHLLSVRCRSLQVLDLLLHRLLHGQLRRLLLVLLFVGFTDHGRETMLRVSLSATGPGFVSCTRASSRFPTCDAR